MKEWKNEPPIGGERMMSNQLSKGPKADGQSDGDALLCSDECASLGRLPARAAFLEVGYRAESRAWPF